LDQPTCVSLYFLTWR